MGILEKILQEIDEIYINIYGEEPDCNLADVEPECQNCIECFKNRCKYIIKKHLSDNDGMNMLEKILKEIAQYEDEHTTIETFALCPGWVRNIITDCLSDSDREITVKNGLTEKEGV